LVANNYLHVYAGFVPIYKKLLLFSLTLKNNFQKSTLTDLLPFYFDAL